MKFPTPGRITNTTNLAPVSLLKKQFPISSNPASRRLSHPLMTPIKNRSVRAHRGLSALIGAFILLPCTLLAQNTPATPPGTAEEEPVILSPFEVVSGRQFGYFASNSGAGTRLNSKLEDLGSSISVVTIDQILDTASVDINDIFRYEANTEGTSQYTEFGVDRNGNVDDTVQRNPETSNRVRGISSANVSLNNFATSRRVPVDSYNLDSVEITRGPNSSLFGLGNPSGTVNLNVGRAMTTREKTQVTFRVDDLGGYRGSFDVNRPLITNKLGVRFSGLYDLKEYNQKPSQDETKRIFGALTYTPFRSTTIRGSYEHYSNFAQRPNSITPRDGVSDWIAAGMPTWDPVTFRANVNGVYTAPIPVGSGSSGENRMGRLPLGLESGGTLYTRPSMFIDNGSLQLWTPNRLGTANPNSPNSNVRNLLSSSTISRFRGSDYPLYVAPGISDSSLYDYGSINFVAPNYSETEADTTMVEIEQRLLPQLFARVGYFVEDVQYYTRNAINSSSMLMVDVNERTLQGNSNPYFLRPFLQVSEPTFYQQPVTNDTIRGELAYELGLKDKRNRLLSLLGDHRILGYAEQRNTEGSQLRFREAVLDDHWYLSAANRTNGSAAARANYRYYLGDTQGSNVDYAPQRVDVTGIQNFHYFDPRVAPGTWVDEPSLFGEAPYVSNRYLSEVRTIGAGLQSFLLKDKVVATAGVRKDKSRSRNSAGAAVDPVSGLYIYDAMEEWLDWQSQEGKTKTYGIVVKPFKGFGLYINKSDSFLPEGPAVDLFLNPLPNPTGNGTDYGFTINLVSDVLIGRVNFYENDSINTRNGDAGIVASRAQRLDFGNDGFNLEDQATGWITALHPEYSNDQIRAAMYDIMQLPPNFIESFLGQRTGDVSNVKSKGVEIELNYNPNRNFSLKFTAAQQEAIQSAISPNIQVYLDERLPVWESIINPLTGDNWWTEGNNSAKAFYDANVIVPLKVAIAQQGKPKSQVRKYQYSFLGRYTFAGVTEHKFLKDVQIGASLRWADKAAIGFFGIPDTDGVIRDLDVNQPIYDPARFSADLWASYKFKLLSDKVRGKIQLNVRDLLESGELRTISTNPDGTAGQYRIINPRSFMLTTTFDL
jgi:outer membrane receptor protein involved in Fe transport